jgi:predicted PolB exonuclease-like 3'-5' exonuclease
MSRPLNCLVFDIETVPDVELGRRLLAMPGAEDVAVAEAMFAGRLEAAGTTFLPLEQHRIVAISALLRSGDQFQVWSIGSAESPEQELLQRFFGGLERLRPTLVSWNGTGFDLLVLHYRMLRHGVASPTYWDSGEIDRDFKWNNYLNRYHARHLDLMDVLSAYQSRGRASLEDMASLLRLPGKLGMTGDQVWPAFSSGRIDEIRDYCETDVLNTYLVYLRFELVRGLLDAPDYDQEVARVRTWLVERREEHWRRFAAAWNVA